MYEYKFIYRRVIDGDNVEGDIDLGFDTVLRKKNVRLRTLDAPESRTRDLVEKEFGLYVKEHIKNRIENSKEIIIKTYKDDRSKYDRVLGELFLDGVSLNEELLAKKYAVPYKGGSKEEIKEQHLKNWEEIRSSTDETKTWIIE
jgi:micrococcal nuclease